MAPKSHTRVAAGATKQSMDKFNPDKTWKVTEEVVEDDSQEAQ
jgi:hypothetical protein